MSDPKKGRVLPKAGYLGFDHPSVRAARITKRQRYVKWLMKLGLPELEAKEFAVQLIPCWER